MKEWFADRKDPILGRRTREVVTPNVIRLGRPITCNKTVFILLGRIIDFCQQKEEWHIFKKWDIIPNEHYEDEWNYLIHSFAFIIHRGGGYYALTMQGYRFIERFSIL
ncbi:MAG: hypothetical protein ABIE68_02980 [bacterium]